MPSIETTLSTNLQRLMKERKMSVQALANILKVERTTIYKWIRCDNFPDTQLINKILDVFNIKPEELFISSKRGTMPKTKKSKEQLIEELNILTKQLRDFKDTK